jgi:putative transposase
VKQTTVKGENMPRPLRIEIKDGWYHVMNRGAARKDIFNSDRHRRMFLELLSEAVGLFGIKIHAYCLMDNHYHLLIQTPRGNLSRTMRHINGIYTQRFNRMEKQDGPLFRGRYKAVLVDKDNYLLQASRYIHMNPVAAKLCKMPYAYKWSSCQYYVGHKKCPAWVTTRETLLMMPGKDKNAAYRSFVREGVDEGTMKFYKKNHTGAILGNKLFKRRHLEALDKGKIEMAKTDYNRTVELPLMAEINAACIKYFSLLRRICGSILLKIAPYNRYCEAAKRLAVAIQS